MEVGPSDEEECRIRGLRVGFILRATSEGGKAKSPYDVTMTREALAGASRDADRAGQDS